MEEKDNPCRLHVPNISLVLDCAELCSLSNEVESMRDEYVINNSEITLHFHAKTSLETEVMILTATSSKCIYVVFRGMKGCKTWLQNNFNSAGRYGPNNTNTPPNTNHRVHNVFNEALFKDDLPRRLLSVIYYLKNDEKYKNYQIVTTGHNFGAALSILFGIYIAVKEPKAFILVINFGCPKVSSLLFQRDVDELNNIAIWRFVLEDDAVCYYPKQGDFCHLGFVVQLFDYESNSNALKNAKRRGEGEDYTIQHYINKLETFEQQKLFDVYYEEFVRRNKYEGCSFFWQCFADGVSY